MGKYIEEVAAELAGSFERIWNGRTEPIVALKEDRPGWIGEDFPRLFHEAIDGPQSRLPNDWLYRLAEEAADYWADCAEGCEDEDASEWVSDNAIDFCNSTSAVPVYDSEVFAWLADNHYNVALADEYAEEFGQQYGKGAADYGRGGMIIAAERMARFIGEAIAEEVAERLNAEEAAEGIA